MGVLMLYNMKQLSPLESNKNVRLVLYPGSFTCPCTPRMLTVVYLFILGPGVQHSRLVGRRAQRRRGYRPQGLPAPCLHPLSSNRYRGTLLSSALWTITVA